MMPPAMGPTEARVPAQVGRPEPAPRPRTDKRPGRPAPPRRAATQAAPPDQRGRCRRRYLRSPRRAGRARGLRGGREVPGWPGAPPGERGPNLTLSLPGLKRLSASLLLSSSLGTQRPPSKPCYGERRGPIPAPLAVRLPELPSAARQPEATGRPPAPASRAGPRWGLGGGGDLGGPGVRSLPLSLRGAAAQASPRRVPAALVRATARASWGRSAALPRLPAPARDYPHLGGRPPAAPARDPQRSPRSHSRRAVPPPLKAAAPAAGEIGPGAPPPSGCGLGRRREQGGALRPGGPARPFKPPPAWAGPPARLEWAGRWRESLGSCCPKSDLRSQARRG